MTLTERCAARAWTEDERRWIATAVRAANACPVQHDLLSAAVARLIGQDGADLLTLRQRAREIVDLALAMQAAAAEARAGAAGAGSQRPALHLVGGRDA